MSYLKDTDRLDSSLPLIHSSRPLSASAALYNDRERHVRFCPTAPQQYGREGGMAMSPNYLRRQSIDQTEQVQDQIRIYREEIAKKDRLITQLSGVNIQRVGGYGYGKIENAFSYPDNFSMVAPPRYDAASQMRTESLQNQVRELQAQLEVKEDKIREQKILNETARESEEKNAMVIQQLQHRLMRYQSEYGNLEDAANRSGIAISSLQDETRESRQRIIELESRLRTHLEEREKAEQDRSVAERRLNELTTELSRLLFVEFSAAVGSFATEEIIRRTEEMSQENAMLKGKMSTMKDYVSNVELEQQTNRETIMRLVNEAEREQKNVSRYTLDVENLVVERDVALAKQEDLMKEIDVMKERFESSQRAWSNMKRELDQNRQHQHQHHQNDFDRSVINQSLEAQHKAFKECLAKLLSDGYINVDPYEEVIRERVQNLVLAIRDKNAQVESFENKLSSIASQLESQYELNRSSERKTKRAEADLLEMEERLRRAENSLSTEDVIRDGCRISQDRFIRSLERIGRALNMAPFSIDMSIENVVDSIIATAEQLSTNDVDNDRKIHIHNLQRKVKSLKEQIECKAKSDSEKEDEYHKNRKLIKLIEKYKIELNEAHLEIRDLKSRLLQTTDIQTIAIAKEADIEKLESRILQLEHIRQKQENTIANLKESLKSQEHGNNVVHSMANEIRTLKLALDELTRHHKQLLDLRGVMARMLGLDVSTMAVPDFEMISRLEKLIIASQLTVASSSSASAVIFDSSVEDMVDEFRRGYQGAGQVVDDVMVQRSRNPSRRVRIGQRSRSLSPLKKKDPKVY